MIDEIQVSWRPVGDDRPSVGRQLLEDAGRLASGREVVVQRGCRTCGSQRHGAPYFGRDASRYVGCSLTYASGLAIAAVTVRRRYPGASTLEQSPLPVGIDAEEVPAEPARNDAPLATRILTAEEQERLRHGPTSSRHADLIHLWTAKEAVLKATGWGLGLDPRAVDLSTTDRCELTVGGETAPFWLWRSAISSGHTDRSVCVASPSTIRSAHAVVEVVGELP